MVDFNVLSSLCWERWGRMTEAQKKRFVQMSECDQVRLDKEMREYKESLKAQTDRGVVVVREILEEILKSVMKERRVRVHDQMNQQLPGGFGEKLVFIFVITFTVQDTTPREHRPTSMSCRGWFSSSRPPPAPPPPLPRTRPITPTSRWWTSSLLGLRVNPNPRTLRWWSS